MGQYSAYIGDVPKIKKCLEAVLKDNLPKDVPYIKIDTIVLEKVAEALKDGLSGIILIGGTGTGKTELMKAIVKVYNAMFDINPVTLTAENMYNSLYGGEGYLYYGNWIDTHLHIDDIGSEPEFYMEFGNKIKPFIEITKKRYEESGDICLTFGTTNLVIKSLSERYGSRIISRLAENNRFIPMNGKDLRLCQRK